MKPTLSVRLQGARPDGFRPFVSAALDTAGSVVAPEDARPDAVIVALGLDSPPGPLIGLTSEAWALAVDRPLRELLGAMQDARSALLPRGGALVVVVPTIGVPGARDLVPLTTVVEGARAMAKSAARQWATDDIAVNMLALPLALLVPELERCTTHVSPAAGHAPSAAELAPMLDVLLRSTTAITGTTVVADGGSVMVP